MAWEGAWSLFRPVGDFFGFGFGYADHLLSGLLALPTLNENLRSYAEELNAQSALFGTQYAAGTFFSDAVSLATDAWASLGRVGSSDFGQEDFNNIVDFGLLLAPAAKTTLAGRSGSIAAEFETATRAGPRVYRQGTFADESVDWGGNYVKGRQWAGENPLTTPDFPKRYGLPAENARPDWVVGGRIRGDYQVRPAPPSHNNPLNTGGAPEYVPRNPDDVILDFFHMPD